jgi:hypothetical protein
MLAILNAEPTYTPNEADLKIETLTTYQNTLITANNNVSTTYTNISNARITRNTTLFKKSNSHIRYCYERKRLRKISIW